MSCHHHHQHHHQHHQHSNSHHHSSCCHGCSTYSSSSCCSPPPNPISDQQQLLQTLILLQSQKPQPQTHFPKPLKPQQQYHHRQQQQPIDKDHSHHQQTQSLLHSLLRRVANLENSLSSFSLQNPPIPKTKKHSIKHLAAATIQTHFRRFLARRSRTLRELKLLASVKSEAANLRSSLSDRTHKLDPQEINRKAVDLLLQLDSIQTADPMIREGKRSISRELVRVTEFVDKVLVRDTARDGPGCTRGGRKVRFAENGHGGKVFDELPERESEVSDEDEDEETHLGDRGFYQVSDGEESPRVSGGSTGLSAPLPAKMEPVRCTTFGIAYAT